MCTLHLKEFRKTQGYTSWLFISYSPTLTRISGFLLVPLLPGSIKQVQSSPYQESHAIKKQYQNLLFHYNIVKNVEEDCNYMYMMKSLTKI